MIRSPPCDKCELAAGRDCREVGDYVVDAGGLSSFWIQLDKDESRGNVLEENGTL